MTKKDLLDGLVSKFLPNKRYQMHIMLKKVYLPPVLLKWPFDTMPVKKKKDKQKAYLESMYLNICWSMYNAYVMRIFNVPVILVTT